MNLSFLSVALAALSLSTVANAAGSFTVTLYSGADCTGESQPLEIPADECGAILKNVPVSLTACASAISSPSSASAGGGCSFGMLGSAGVKLVEEGKSVALKGYISTIFNTLPLTSPYVCPVTCTFGLPPTCSSGSQYTCTGLCPDSNIPYAEYGFFCPADRSAGERCVENAKLARKVDLGSFPLDSCGAFSASTKQSTGIGSVKVTKSGLSGGAIAGIIIGVLAAVGLAAGGFMFHKKLGPFKPKVASTSSTSGSSVASKDVEIGGQNPMVAGQKGAAV